jgi:hypothetical protein
MKIKVVPNEKGNPPGKLADAELHFTCVSTPDLDIIENALRQLHEDSGKLRDDRIEAARAAVRRAREQQHVLDGLKLTGFGVWERRTGDGRNVTFPARQYSVNGERRSFALLRPVADVQAQDRIRELILEAYREFEEQLTHQTER